MMSVLRPYLVGSVVVGGLLWLTLLPRPQTGAPRVWTTEDYGCPAGISVTREYRPGRGATLEEAVEALITAWYPDTPSQTVQRLPVRRPNDPAAVTYLIRREGEPFETVLVRRAPYEGRNGFEAILDQICGSHARNLRR